MTTHDTELIFYTWYKPLDVETGRFRRRSAGEDYVSQRVHYRQSNNCTEKKKTTYS